MRTLMTIEKDQCISELVERHEEETNLLRADLSTMSTLYEQTCELEKRLQEQVLELDTAVKTHTKQIEEKTIAMRGQLEHYEATVLELVAEKELLLVTQQRDREVLLQSLSAEKEGAICAALKEVELQRETVEKGLLEKIQHLEKQVNQRSSDESCSGNGTHLVCEHQKKLEEQEKKMNEEMQSLKTSLIAEQQTHFNTVLTREKLKKESIINELSELLRTVTQQQDRDKALIETLSADRAHLLEEKKKLEEELSNLRSSNCLASTCVTSVSETSGACAPDLAMEMERLTYEAAGSEEERIYSVLETSMMPVRENIHMLSEEKQRIMLLEKTLQLKEEENKRLNQRLMSQSMSSVSSRHSEKIAIRDFQVGDLVLIILDERHDNYVLFTVSPTLFFLHSESLTVLDLKAASGASRRPWVLGKVMEKEYCQAKKAQNRFKVPLGTKFYRVKAVPWNKKV